MVFKKLSGNTSGIFWLHIFDPLLFFLSLLFSFLYFILFPGNFSPLLQLKFPLRLIFYIYLVTVRLFGYSKKLGGHPPLVPSHLGLSSACIVVAFGIRLSAEIRNTPWGTPKPRGCIEIPNPQHWWGRVRLPRPASTAFLDERTLRQAL